MKKGLGRLLSVLVMLLVMGMTVCATDADDIKKNRVFQTNSDVELHEGPDTASTVTATLPAGTPVIIKEDAKDGWCMVSYKEDAGYVQISYLGILGSQITPQAADSSNATENVVVPSDETKSDEEIEANSEMKPDDDSAINSETESVKSTEIDGETQSEEATIPNDEAKPDNGATSNDTNGSEAINNSALDDEFKRVEEAGILAYQEAEAAKAQAESERTWGIVIAVLVIAIFAVGIITTVRNNKGKKK